MSNFGIPYTMVTVPGSTVNIGGPQSASLLKFAQPPNDSMGFPVIPVETENPEESANGTVTYSYPLYPYADKTHEYIQPGMLTFISKHIDPKYKIFNMVPIFKMNIMQNEAWKEFQSSNDTTVTTFRTMLSEYGERVLDEYRGQKLEDDRMSEFFKLAKRPEFKYITKFGILNAWNFAAPVLTKGESTGPGVFMDHHSSTDIVFVASVNAAKQARVSNVWGKAAPGDRLRLFLTKKDGPNSPFIWIPYNLGPRQYAPRKFTKYEDLSGRTCDSHQEKVGTVSLAPERDTMPSQCQMALGYYNDNVKDAYEANGSLTTLIVQIRI